jgi:hypothetical protein
MNRATAPGSYRGKLTSVGAGKSKGGHIQFQVSGVWDQFKPESGRTYDPLEAPESLEGWFYLTNKNGVAEKTIDSLKRAFGMPKSLPQAHFLREIKRLQAEEGDAFYEREFSCKAELEEDDEGNDKLRMSWLNPPRSGFQMPEGQEFDTLEAEFEAIANGSPSGHFDNLPGSPPQNDLFPEGEPEF